VSTLMQDLRFGARMLKRRPGFTAAAVLTIGLGIGATTAIFAVVYGVLLRPLPYPEPGRLAYISADAWRIFSSGREYLAWKDRSQTLSEIAAYIEGSGNMTGGSEAERVTYGTATASFFQLLGVRPVLGRVFLPEEDRPGHPPAAVIGQNFWNRHFGGDPAVIGRTVTIDAKAYTVVGVLPAGFLVPDQYGADYSVWIPFSAGPDGPIPFVVRVIGRLKPKASYEQVRAELDTILQSTVRKGITRRATVTPWHEDITAKAKLPLTVFLVAVGFVLLIACVNVANLMLSRAAARETEMAVRLALGAGKQRILRQLLTESTLISLSGGILGFGVAVWGKDLLVAFISTTLPTLEPVRLDYRVLGFSLGLALLTGVAFGFAPGFLASRVSLNESLKEAGRRAAEGRPGHYHLRSLLVVFEVALAMVLLIGAGLLFRSFLRLREMDTGFRPGRILCFSVNLTPSEYAKPEDQIAFFQQAIDRITSLPGVESIAAGSSLPSEAGDLFRGLTIEGRLEPVDVRYRAVSADYFRTLAIPLVQGRYFADSDHEGRPSVAAVNESFAREFFPGGNCLGRRIGGSPGKNDWTTIVGVVGDVRPWSEGESSPEVYLPYLQAGELHMDLAVRTRGESKSLVKAVRGQIANVDRGQPPYDITTLEERRAQYLTPRSVNMLLLGAFAGLALILGLIGIYGVISYSVSQRTHEIGIRMALGAERGDVLSLVVGQGLVPALLGELAGLAAALALNKVISSLVFQVATTDAVTYAGVAAIWTVVALLACYLPARRATNVDPTVALRCN